MVTKLVCCWMQLGASIRNQLPPLVFALNIKVNCTRAFTITFATI